MRAPCVALLALLAGCAAEEAAQVAAPRAVSPAEGPAALAARLPASAGAFDRGANAPLPEPAGAREVAYATADRRAAAIVQVLPSPGPLPDGAASPAARAAYERWRDQATQGSGPHRRLRVVSEAEAGGLFRCADLEGSYGRQPVQSTICAGAAGGQILRIRLSMPRRDPPVADPQAFVRDLTEALRRG